jgi:hypothetical protein
MTTPDENPAGSGPDEPASPHEAAGPAESASPDETSPHGAAGPAESASPDEAAGADEQVRSGLRDPAAAVRGVGAGALVIEALVLLLAIVPLTKLDTRATGWAIGTVVALCVLCILLAGLLRHAWAWYAGAVVQVLICLCGFYHPMLLVFGIVFGAIWGYVLSVRRSVLGD